jgi:hypothetical protein
MNKKKYPSSTTREQFAEIASLLESAKNKTNPITLDLYEVFNVVLYILKTGCQWRALPHEFPCYRRVHYYFMTWRNGEILSKVLKKLVGEIRQNNCRKEKTSFISLTLSR